MNRREFIKQVLLRSLGNFLVLFSIYGVIATFGPAVYYELQYRVIEARGVKFRVSEVPPLRQDSAGQAEVSGGNTSNVTKDPVPRRKVVSFTDIMTGSKEQILIPKDTLFSITIPKIGASAKVFPNIDPGNSQEFLPVLKQGIAHAKGSVFPGLNGNIYLFAHSTDNWWDVGRYNAIFYLLKDLSPGDEVIVFFENIRHDYVVTRSVITGPADVSFIANDQKGDEQLVLQTCWPPGTTWKRLYVLAAPKSVK